MVFFFYSSSLLIQLDLVFFAIFFPTGFGIRTRDLIFFNSFSEVLVYN